MAEDSSGKDPMDGIVQLYLVPPVIGFAALAAALGMLGEVGWRDVVADATVAALAGYVALIVQDAVPDWLKNLLVYWRTRDASPGHRLLTLADEHDRYDLAEVAARVPEAERTPKGQNQLWNRWLGEFRSEPRVLGAHRRYIGTRDAAVLCAVLAVFALALGLWPSTAWSEVRTLSSTYAVAYLVLMLASQNAAKRLVTNVVACKMAAKMTTGSAARAKPRAA